MGKTFQAPIGSAPPAKCLELPDASRLARAATNAVGGAAHGAEAAEMAEGTYGERIFPSMKGFAFRSCFSSGR
jgi:hypothetical protein